MASRCLIIWVLLTLALSAAPEYEPVLSREELVQRLEQGWSSQAEDAVLHLQRNRALLDDAHRGESPSEELLLTLALSGLQASAEGRGGEEELLTALELARENGFVDLQHQWAPAWLHRLEHPLSMVNAEQRLRSAWWRAEGWWQKVESELAPVDREAVQACLRPQERQNETGRLLTRLTRARRQQVVQEFRKLSAEHRQVLKSALAGDLEGYDRFREQLKVAGQGLGFRMPGDRVLAQRLGREGWLDYSEDIRQQLRNETELVALAFLTRWRRTGQVGPLPKDPMGQKTMVLQNDDNAIRLSGRAGSWEVKKFE